MFSPDFSARGRVRIVSVASALVLRAHGSAAFGSEPGALALRLDRKVLGEPVETVVGDGEEEAAEPRDPFGVEPVGRLVGDQHTGVAEQCVREPEALTHPERVGADAPAARAMTRRWSRPERPGWNP